MNNPFLKEYKLIMDAKDEDKVKLFFEYCTKIIDLKNSNKEIEVDTASRWITSCIADDYLMKEGTTSEEIIDLASMLEIPSWAMSHDPKLWTRLVHLVQKGI